MLNKSLKLNTDVFDKDVEQVPLRNGFGEGLLEAGKRDENIVGLCADLTGSTRMNLFADEFPERFVEVGIGEQNLVAVASGMAALGKVPFVSSYAMFSPGRNWEQIRTTVCYNDQAVKVVGSHAGVSVGPDGGTHQAIEDIALTRILPRMEVIVPCDIHEAYRATLAMAKTVAPTYLRLARENTPVMTTKDTPFEIGKSYELWRSDAPRVAIIGAGPILHNALLAAKELDATGVGSVVLNMHTIKPLDEERVVELAKECGAVVSVEAHQVAGGIGSAIAELLMQKEPTRMQCVGVQDRFGQSGTPEELLKEYQLDVESIKSAVEKVLG